MNLPAGLSSEEAARRHRSGANEIVPSTMHSRLAELGQLLLDPMGLMLLTLSALYFALGDRTDAIVLLIAYIPVTAVDVILEMRAQRALRALQSGLKTTASVVRDGRVQTVATREIVAGDVLVFEEGQALPADGSVLDGHDLHVNEAALTGESLPVEKPNASPFYAGTTVLEGRGFGMVEQIGADTRFGKIAQLIEQAESDKSPLRQKVDAVVKKVGIFAVVLTAVLWLLEYFRQGEVVSSLIVALTFGMAAVPEEFPLVFTLYLSLGAWRLSRSGVLVKSLPSVETLGGVDVICTDKTGTLTEGHFQMQELSPWTDSSVPVDTLWLYALMACEETPLDAMDLAIHAKATEAHKSALKEWHLQYDYPFERQGKHMSHVWNRTTAASQQVIVMKGAVEGVLEHCQIAPDERARLMVQVEKLAGQGRRLLGLAARAGQCSGQREEDERDMRFMALLIFSDPVRGSVKQAIQSCQDAGISIKMLTGDHPYTAHAVADETGIDHSHDFLYTGDELARMSLSERMTAYQKGAVFSRVLPEQKYEMVQALKAAGKVVAMTGDGINDAPALKLADIGISMGRGATDVARSSAQMVLLKNDFQGIVAAVFEGRKIFANLKRSFSYLVSFHTPIVILAFVPPALGWGDLFLPIHIVLLEMVVHPVSAFAFENLPANPHDNARELLSRDRLLEAVLSGLLISVFAISFHENGYVADLDSRRALALATVLFGNIFFVLTESWPVIGRRFLATALILGLLTLVIFYLPWARALFHLNVLSPQQLLWTLGLGLVASLPTLWLRISRANRTKLKSQ